MINISPKERRRPTSNGGFAAPEQKEEKVKKNWLITILISVLIVMAASGMALAGGGQNVLDYSFVIKVKSPPPPDIRVEQLTEPKLEISQGEAVRLAYRIANPIQQTRWAKVQLFSYSETGISYDVSLDGKQYVPDEAFPIEAGSSHIIEFLFRLPVGNYSTRITIDQVPAPLAVKTISAATLTAIRPGVQVPILRFDVKTGSQDAPPGEINLSFFLGNGASIKNFGLIHLRGNTSSQGKNLNPQSVKFSLPVVPARTTESFEIVADVAGPDGAIVQMLLGDLNDPASPRVTSRILTP